ncbi:MAG: hypothetical protein ABIJ45_11165 [Candidatus Zixiibacteriota bacterium]
MKRLLYTGIIFFIPFCMTCAGDIQLKNSLITGWQYTDDGGYNYYKIGRGAGILYLAMNDNKESLNEILQYRSNHFIAELTGYPAGFLLGWVAGATMTGNYDDSRNTHQTMLTIGVPLALISIVFEIIADNHLKNSVKIFNDQKQVPGLQITMKNNISTHHEQVKLAINYRF